MARDRGVLVGSSVGFALGYALGGLGTGLMLTGIGPFLGTLRGWNVVCRRRVERGT